MCVSVYIYIYLCVLEVYSAPTYLLTCIHSKAHLLVRPSVCLSVRPPAVRPSVRLSLSVCLSRPSVRLSLSVCLSLCLSVTLSRLSCVKGMHECMHACVWMHHTCTFMIRNSGTMHGVFHFRNLNWPRPDPNRIQDPPNTLGHNTVF